jgi:CubicO group peptidase (beta-lactamase class C family)
VAWPTAEWPRGDPPDAVAVDLERLLDDAFDDTGPLATTYAVIVVHGGKVVAERYQGALEHFDRPSDPVTAQTPLLSWSMAKSMLHAVVGMLVGDGRLDLDAPADVRSGRPPTTPVMPSPCATSWPCATGSTSSRTTSTSGSPM